MNIFVFSELPKENSIFHCNKHLYKMPIETAQILAAIHSIRVEIGYELPSKDNICCRWANSSLGNYRWLATLGIELCAEYLYRFGKEHKMSSILLWLSINEPVDLFLDNNLYITRHVLLMPKRYRLESAAESYRSYFCGEKNHLAEWGPREKPYWYNTASSHNKQEQLGLIW